MTLLFCIDDRMNSLQIKEKFITINFEILESNRKIFKTSKENVFFFFFKVGD